MYEHAPYAVLRAVLPVRVECAVQEDMWPLLHLLRGSGSSTGASLLQDRPTTGSKGPLGGIHCIGLAVAGHKVDLLPFRAKDNKLKALVIRVLLCDTFLAGCLPFGDVCLCGLG